MFDPEDYDDEEYVRGCFDDDGDFVEIDSIEDLAEQEDEDYDSQDDHDDVYEDDYDID